MLTGPVVRDDTGQILGSIIPADETGIQLQTVLMRFNGRTASLRVTEANLLGFGDPTISPPVLFYEDDGCSTPPFIIAAQSGVRWLYPIAVQSGNDFYVAVDPDATPVNILRKAHRDRATGICQNTGDFNQNEVTPAVFWFDADLEFTPPFSVGYLD